MNSNLFPQQKLSVLMVDDHAMMREAYKRILETIEFVGFVEVASSAEQAIDILKQTNYDIVLMDYKFSGGMKGSEATKWITEHKPQVKVIGISSIEFLNIGIEFIINGAKGFFEKGLGDEKLELALLSVYNGGSYFNQEIHDELLNSKLNFNSKQNVALTDRDYIIIDCLYKAMNSKEIGEKLDLKPRRVEQLINEIYTKTGCKTQFQLAIFLAVNKVLK